MGRLIAITGNTGVGKTTLARALVKKCDFNLGLEKHNDRPFQNLFKNDASYALANQIDYLLLRAEQECYIRRSPLIGLVDGGLDQDFHGYTRLFYSRNLLTAPEYDLCRRLYQFCREQYPTPDLIIHLTASNEAIQLRLARRNRINIARPDDLTLLDSFLEEWLACLSPKQVLYLDVTSASPTYEEIVPSLCCDIQTRLGLDTGSYDTGFIP